MDQELPARRHPEVVSRSGSFTTAALDYTPPPELDVGLIAGHPWGVRTITLVCNQVQYMVYDKRGRNVLSCMPTPELAAQYAIERLEQEAIPPQSFSPRLAGMRFGQRADQKSAFLTHTVVDEQGQVVAESSDGRSAAASLAVTALVSRSDCLDATWEEFATTVVLAKVTRAGSRALPLVFDGSEARDQERVISALRSIWRADPRLQNFSESEIMPGSPDMKTFVVGAQTGLLRYAAKLGGNIQSMDMHFAQPERVVRFAFHDGAMGREQLIDTLYEDYQRKCAQELQSQQERPVRPVE